MAENETTPETTTEEATSSAAPTEAPTSEAESLINIENLIKTHLSRMESLREEAKKFSDMLADILINSGVYAEHEEAAKEAIKTKNITKKELLKEPSAVDLTNKVKALKSEVKEHQESLNFYLQEYYRLSGISQIEDLNGEIRDIVYTAKLVKKK